MCPLKSILRHSSRRAAAGGANCFPGAPNPPQRPHRVNRPAMKVYTLLLLILALRADSATGQATGACCSSGLPGCSDVTQAACDSASGQYEGDGTDCAGDGAVCISRGCCVNSNQNCENDVSYGTCLGLGVSNTFFGDEECCDLQRCQSTPLCATPPPTPVPIPPGQCGACPYDGYQGQCSDFADGLCNGSECIILDESGVPVSCGTCSGTDLCTCNEPTCVCYPEDPGNAQSRKCIQDSPPAPTPAPPSPTPAPLPPGVCGTCVNDPEQTCTSTDGETYPGFIAAFGRCSYIGSGGAISACNFDGDPPGGDIGAPCDCLLRDNICVCVEQDREITFEATTFTAETAVACEVPCGFCPPGSTGGCQPRTAGIAITDALLGPTCALLTEFAEQYLDCGPLQGQPDGSGGFVFPQDGEACECTEQNLDCSCEQLVGGVAVSRQCTSVSDQCGVCNFDESAPGDSTSQAGIRLVTDFFFRVPGARRKWQFFLLFRQQDSASCRARRTSYAQRNPVPMHLRSVRLPLRIHGRRRPGHSGVSPVPRRTAAAASCHAFAAPAASLRDVSDRLRGM